ncbi:MAG: K(+)-transporting ATPase subunit F [Pirellulaceae bacterium]
MRKKRGYCLARSRHRFLRRFDAHGPSAYASALGGLAVDWTVTLSLGIALFLFVYLCVALFAPERFS